MANHKVLKAVEIVFFLFLLASCSEPTSTEAPISTIPVPIMVEPSPTGTAAIITTIVPSETPEGPTTSTATPTSLATLSLPLNPGPVITKDNIKQLILLGTIKETLRTDMIGSQISWSPDSKQIALATKVNGIRFIDPLVIADIGGIVEDGFGPTNSIWDVAYNPDGKSLAASIEREYLSTTTHLEIWDINTNEVEQSYPDYGPDIYILKYSNNGRYLAIGEHMAISVLDTNTKRNVFSYRITYPSSLWFSPNDRYLAFSGVGYPTVIVNTTTWTIEKGFTGLGNICFSPDNKAFLGEPGIWSLNDMKPLITIRDDFIVNLCNYGKNGDIIFSTKLNGEISVLDASDGSELMNLRSSQKTIYDMALSPDGRFLASVGWDDGTVGIWGVPGE